MTRELRLGTANHRAQARARSTVRRNAILGAARRVFAEVGYEGASLSEIARRASVPPGAVEPLFADKDAILRTLVDESARRLRLRVRAARDKATTLEEFIGEGYRAFFTFVAGDRVAFGLLRREPATLRLLLDQPVLAATVAELRDDLDAAVARGEFPPVDLEYLTAAMAGVGVEVALRMVERDPVDVDGATTFATGLFLGGLDRLHAGARPRRPRGRQSR